MHLNSASEFFVLCDAILLQIRIKTISRNVYPTLIDVFLDVSIQAVYACYGGTEVTILSRFVITNVRLYYADSLCIELFYLLDFLYPEIGVDAADG